MEKFKENEIKYLAGLLDADGSLSFKFCKSSSGKTFLYLILGISASKRIDKQGYLYSLGQRMGSISEITYENENHNDAVSWKVQSRSELDQIIPRLLKHMVIKARHWNRLYSVFTDNKGKDITDSVEKLKEFSEESRKDVGPLKPKKHPTWAWVAGYLDGDGCYTFKPKQMHVGAISHVQDSCALYLLHKAFGGSVYAPRDDNTQLWRRGIGKTNSDFAKMFLSNIVRHSRLKKWKIEQILAFHNQPQRLNESTSTDEVIV